MATLPLRQIEGKYEIVAKIKEGGMGAIYKVRHLLLEEIRVIKVIRQQVADDQDLQRRFAREARAAIRLKHPNIAQLYDFAVEADGAAYMVMEFIDGVTLQEMLAKNGPAQLDLTLEIARQSLEALRYLHLQGYVHRDVAPDNLMLTRDFAGQPLVKLIDLGIVKHLAGGGEGLTATGTFLGKVRYSSPEQFSGEKGGLDHRSDLYSFGVMLYELLTGVCPIAGENLSQLVSAHLFQPPKSFEETDPQGRVPKEVRAAVMKSLEKAPDQRFASAQEFQALLERPASQDLTQDLETTLAATINVRLPEQTPAGTTQDRIDAQFGLERTPGPGPGLRAADGLAADDRREGLAKLLTEAKRFAQDRQWEESRLRLYQALAIDHDHQEVRALLATVESSLAKAVEEEKRRQALAAVVERIGARLDEEQLDAATRELEQARAEYGAQPELARLETRIAELGRILAERARQSAIAATVAAIAADLDAERADPAASALAAAVSRFGEDERFAALTVRLAELGRVFEQRRREAEAAARRERARALLDDAAELAGRQAFADAIARAQEAVSLDPEGPGRQALERYRADEARHTEEIRRQRALDQAVVKIDKLLAREQTEAAAAELETAVAEFGDSERLGSLRDTLAALRSKLAERAREEERRQAIAAAVSSIESHLERENVADAQHLLEEASVRLGADARFESLAKSIARLELDLAERQRKLAQEESRRREEELRRQEEERLRREAQARRAEEERRQRAEAEARRRQGQALLRQAAEQAGRGELTEALASARGALELDPEPARAAIEKYELALEEAARAQRLQQLLAAARSEMAAGALDPALARLQTGRREYGDDAEWRELVASIEAEIERQAAERERQEAIASEAAAVEQLIAKGRLEKAQKRLEKARAKVGDGATLLELDRRLESLRLEGQRADAQRREEQRAEAQRAEAQRAEAKRAEAHRAETRRAEAERVEEARRLEAQRRAAAALEMAPPAAAEPRPARRLNPAVWAAAAGVAIAIGAGAWWALSSSTESTPSASVAQIGEVEETATGNEPAVKPEPRGVEPSTSPPRTDENAEQPSSPPRDAKREASTAAADPPPPVAPEPLSPRSGGRTEAAAPKAPIAVEPPPPAADQAPLSGPAKRPVQEARAPAPRADPPAKSAVRDTAPGSATQRTAPPAGERPAPSTAERPAPVEAAQLPVERLPDPPQPQPTAVAVRPTPQPARPAEQPPAPPPPAAPDPREQVQVALSRYSAAYASLDASAVARVFTGVNERELQRAFRQYKSANVGVVGCTIAIDGDRATASCDVTRTIDPKAGEGISRTQRETFHLRKVSQEWVVERVQ